MSNSTTTFQTRNIPPRRSHNKSRNGCATCKKRRIKCDEQGPPCGNCTVRQIECIYTKGQRQHPINQNQATKSREFFSNKFSLPLTRTTTSSPKPQHSPHESGGQRGFRTRSLDLQLLHHYITKTCQTLDVKPGLSEIWRDAVVREALSHHFLMDGILALASFHVALETSEIGRGYILYALEYQNNAFEVFYEALRDVNRGNANAIFVFSIVTMICALVPPQRIAAESGNVTTDRLLTLFDYLQGIGSVTALCGEWLKPGPFQAFFTPRDEHDPALMREDTRLAFQQLRAVGLQMSSTNSEQPDPVYQHAIEFLETCFADGPAMAIVWLAMVRQDFVTLVKQSDPLALLIFVHWGVLLDQLKGFWWAGDCGKVLVGEASHALDQVGSFWTDATRWARSRVDVHQTESA